MMVEYAKTKASKSSETTTQTRISEIVFDMITYWKLDENNYLN